MKRKNKIIIATIIALAIIVSMFTLTVSADELDDSIIKLPEITLAIDMPSDYPDTYINLPTTVIDGYLPSSAIYQFPYSIYGVPFDTNYIINTSGDSATIHLPFVQNGFTNWGQTVTLYMRDVGYSSNCSEIRISTQCLDADYVSHSGFYYGSCTIVYEINDIKYTLDVTLPESLGSIDLIRFIRLQAQLSDDIVFYIKDLTLECLTDMNYMEKDLIITIFEFSNYCTYSSRYRSYLDVLALDAYHEGFVDGHSTSELDLQNKYDAGYNAGYKKGYEKGDVDGYNYAYEFAAKEYQNTIDELQSKYNDAKDGLENSNAVLNFFQGILAAVQGTLNTFFNLEVFGFRLGNIVAILLGALLVIVVLKFII